MAADLQGLRDEILAEFRSKGEPVCYDLGCGQSPEPGFIGVDLDPTDPATLHADLYSYPWPFADESVDYFRSSHFLEHVPDFVAHMREIQRCLKPGGCYEVLGPYYASRRFFQDPDHKTALLEEKFWYLSAEWRRKTKQSHRRDLAGVNLVMVNWFERYHDDFVDKGFSPEDLHYRKLHEYNVIEDCATVLRKEPMPE